MSLSRFVFAYFVLISVHQAAAIPNRSMTETGRTAMGFDAELGRHEIAQIYVRVKIKNNIVKIELEQYLRGVLPSEMPARWPIEALKAQAVAARTYVLRQMSLRKNASFDVDSTVLDQVYDIENYNRLNAGLRARIDQALRETAGLHLSDHRGRIRPAYFHADCGGEPEQAKNVWGEERDLQFLNVSTIFSVTEKDTYCSENASNQWSHQISKAELNSKIRRRFRLPSSDEIVNFSVTRSQEQSRVQTVNFELRSGRVIEINSQIFRELYGFSKVKSTIFQYEFSSTALALRGKGYGHGVGLCQSGARFMAEDGADFMTILQKYYPQAIISRPHLFAQVKF